MKTAWMLVMVPAMAWGDTSSREAAFVPKRIGLGRTIVPKCQELYGVAFSPDGRRIAVAGADGTVRVISTSTWKEEKKLGTHAGGAWCVAWSADGKLLATGGLDNRAIVWETATWKEKATLNGHASYVYGVSFSPDGRKVLTAAADNTARVWDAATGGELRSFAGHTSYVTCAVFSPNGKLVATASYDSTIKLWDAETGAERNTLMGHTNAVLGVSFSRDGRTLASASADQSVRTWDVAGARELKSMTGHSGQVHTAVWTPDGRHLVTCGAREVKIWDPQKGVEEAALNHHTQEVQGVAVGPGGRWIASVSIDLQLKIWTAVPGGTTKLKPKGFFGVSVQTSPDGCQVQQVLPGTAAETSGIQVNDIITAVNGVKVADHQEAIGQIGSHSEGDEIEFTVKRDGRELKIKATLGKRPANQ
jgi:WD40 repeat protein